MNPEVKQQLARSLEKNEYFRELFEERANEIRDEWESTAPGDAETRERKFVELNTLTELQEFIYARISVDAGDGAN